MIAPQRDELSIQFLRDRLPATALAHLLIWPDQAPELVPESLSSYER